MMIFDHDKNRKNSVGEQVGSEKSVETILLDEGVCRNYQALVLRSMSVLICRLNRNGERHRFDGFETSRREQSRRDKRQK